jgi:GST-like protein
MIHNVGVRSIPHSIPDTRKRDVSRFQSNAHRHAGGATPYELRGSAMTRSHRPHRKTVSSGATVNDKPRSPQRAAKALKTKRTTKAVKLIDLYYWPTPNGRKITIMLEECRLPYRIIPIDVSKGDQFTPEFLAISPNNRMPAIIDPDGPGGRPISVFESGAILQYLGRKTGKFYPMRERERVAVEEWLFWQMANLGPKAGECHHFRLYAADRAPYATERFTNECNRLYSVMDRRLEHRDFLAGAYSIADMACLGWARYWQRQGQDIAQFPNLKRWLERVLARPAVDRGMHVRVEAASQVNMADPKVRAVLFGQRAI